MNLPFIRTLARPLALSAILTLSANSAFAGHEVNEHLKASADGLIIVDVVSSDISIVGWGRQEVTVKGTLPDNAEKLIFEESGGTVRIKVKYQKRSGRRGGSSHLDIQIPEKSRLKLSAVSGDITIKNLQGALDLSTVSGKLHATAVSGELELETVSGDILVSGALERVVSESVSGDIKLESDTTIKEGRFETVSGDVSLRGKLSTSARIEFESVSGDLELVLPADTSARVELDTFSGSLISDLGGKPTSADGDVSFQLGDGGARIDLETFSGDIRLRKQ